jgi:hypothetical protein
MAKTLTARLHQTDGPKGIRLFEIFDHRFLRVRQTIGRSTPRDYAMDISILSPSGHPEHRAQHHWLWLAVAAAVLVLTSVTALFLEFANPLTLLPLTGMLLAITIICLTEFLRSRRHLLVFDSRYATVPLVELLINQPERDSYAAFVAGLDADIANLLRDKALSPTDLRAGELRSLRKLLEQQIIDNATYQTAKQRLLAQAS